MNSELVNALRSPDAWPHPVERVQVVETHISWVLLTGRFAYKIKKPLALDFLDFSTLAKRRHFCEEELRLNRRTAPQLYLGVVPITGSTTAPTVEGDGEAIEFALRMRQFPAEARADCLLEEGRLSAQALTEFAVRLSDVHASADRSQSARFGDPSVIARRMLGTLEQLEAAADPAARAHVSVLRDWTEAALDELHELLADRAARGMVRECHGDLHLSNLVELDGVITAFDCIEFAPALRWTDVIDDAAFLIMDLQLRDRDDLGYGFLDSYLAASGDYEAMPLLDLYRMHRSIVRARVAAIGRGQAGDSGDLEAMRDKELRHLRLALRFAESRKPVLILMHGMSGSGKSWLSERLVPALPGLRLRSDVERKRLAGLAAHDRSDSPPGGGLYSEERNLATYSRLAELTRTMLAAGHDVIVDATFLSRSRRTQFFELARGAAAACVVIDCFAPDSVLERRVTRRAAGSEVSEAGIAVLRNQLACPEPIGADEEATVLRIDTTQETDIRQLAGRINAARR